MEKLTPKQKRNFIAELICLQHSCGYDISYLIGLPLGRFDYDKVKNRIGELIIEWQECNGCEYYPYYIEQN